jgi:hypothetical protein
MTTSKKFDVDKAVAYLQDGQFMGFVEQAGASEIKGSARDAGFIVEDFGCFFNVVYKPIKKMAKSEVIVYND